MQNRKQLINRLKTSFKMLQVLQALETKPKTFGDLDRELKMSTRTLTKHLQFLRRDGLVGKNRWNTPYFITKKGKERLNLLAQKPSDDYTIEFVKSGEFAGSIIFRVPKRFVAVFNRLYQPGPLKGLERAFLVAFEFWVNRYGCDVVSMSTGQRTGGTVAFGRDFNNDKIWDLAMYETPASGYPNIKKALKKGTFLLDGKKVGIDSVNLWIWCLNTLEERLSKAQY